jgi:hypothetical protein
VSRTFTTLVNLLSGHRIRYYNGLTEFPLQRDALAFQLARLRISGRPHDPAPRPRGQLRRSSRAAQRAGQGTTKAFTLRNICSVGHTLLEIWIRRLGKLIYPESTRRPHNRLRVFRAATLGAGDPTTTTTGAGPPRPGAGTADRAPEGLPPA